MVSIIKCVFYNAISSASGAKCHPKVSLLPPSGPAIASLGSGKRRGRQPADRPLEQQIAHPPARFLPDQPGPAALALRDHRSEDDVAGNAESEARVVAVDPVLEGQPCLGGLQGALRPR